MPEPLSSNSGLGMKVTVLPKALPTFFTTYLKVTSLSAMFSRVSKRIPISPCPPDATSWWCSSTGMPRAMSVAAISERRSWYLSIGGTGK